MRNVLLSSVSHDLRTPLTVIRGAAGALAEQNKASPELAKTIADEAERLDRHIRNLLDMSRLEASAIRLNLEWHSIEELIGSALERSSVVLGERRVATYIPPGLSLIRVDGVLVEKALSNLLENAARYSAPDAEIEIRVTTPSQAVRIQVADRGQGIPAGEEQRIFERFVGSSKEGFGLGLAICRAVAEAHGGRIWAENRAGGGARFYLEIPATAPTPEVPHE
jgi:two-component system sensor histidine kinase KdpD